jgi:hypothetical protein
LIPIKGVDASLTIFAIDIAKKEKRKGKGLPAAGMEGVGRKRDEWEAL